MKTPPLTTKCQDIYHDKEANATINKQHGNQYKVMKGFFGLVTFLFDPAEAKAL